MEYVGIALFVFGVGSLGMFAVIKFTSGQSWHDRHHTNRSELMCDRCRDRYAAGPPSAAPPFRVLGGRRV